MAGLGIISVRFEHNRAPFHRVGVEFQSHHLVNVGLESYKMNNLNGFKAFKVLDSLALPRHSIFFTLILYHRQMARLKFHCFVSTVWQC